MSGGARRPVLPRVPQFAAARRHPRRVARLALLSLVWAAVGLLGSCKSQAAQRVPWRVVRAELKDGATLKAEGSGDVQWLVGAKGEANVEVLSNGGVAHVTLERDDGVRDGAADRADGGGVGADGGGAEAGRAIEVGDDGVSGGLGAGGDAVSHSDTAGAGVGGAGAVRDGPAEGGWGDWRIAAGVAIGFVVGAFIGRATVTRGLLA